MPQLIDISRTLSKNTAAWPGDTTFSSEQTTRISEGSNVNTTRFTTSPHVGTHVDAPFHVDTNGDRMGSYDLNIFYGQCQVIEVLDVDQIEPRHLPDSLPPRVVFKTDASDREEDAPWYDGFTSLHPDLPGALSTRGVLLVGTDAASVDQADSSKLPAHHACFAHGITIMENLFLRGVKPGTYTLSAFPIKCSTLEAAPVRAVLVH